MKAHLIFLLAIVFCFTMAPVIHAFAQNEGDETLVLVKTRDGNEFIGTITFEDDQRLDLKTEKFGEVRIQKTDILRRELIASSRIVDGNVWRDTPQSTRYFFGPSGHGIKKGETYYQNVWIFFNQFTHGVTDNFSISAGIVPLFLFAGAPTPMWVNPKVSIPVVKDKYNIGAGALVGTVIGEGGTNFGILYGVNTFGNRDRNLTIGLGWGFADGTIATKPTVSISGMYRTGARGYLLTENYILNAGNESIGLLSFGGRRIISDMGLDFGLMIPVTELGVGLIAIPWLGLTIPIGKPNKPSEF